MSSVYDHHATPAWLVPDGLQARADWALPSPASSPSRVQSSSPHTYPSPNFECYYQPHDPRDCVHARLLCDKRFADLQALMADLERCQCRCGQSTWGRTKSFFGGLKKRALSLRGRKKSQDGHELEPTQEQEWPGVSHPSATAGELPAVRFPAELGPNQMFTPELDPNLTFTPELDSAPWPATHPGGPSSLAAGMNFSPSSMPCTQSFGDGQVGYGLNATMAPLARPALRPRLQVPPVHELAAQIPPPNPYQAAWYSAPTTAHASFAVVSPISPSPLSSPGSHSLVSPQSSISGFRTRPTLFTDATSAGVAEDPMFAEQTTASPVEYGQDDDIAPWDGQEPPSTVHQNSWDSETTLAELPCSYDTGSGQVHWLQRPLNGQLAELEGAMPLPKSSAVPVHHSFGSVQSIEPVELAGSVNFQTYSVTSPWYMRETMDTERQSTTGSPSTSRFAAHPSPPRQPRPLLSRSQHSYDSTTSTVLGIPTLDGAEIKKVPKVPSPPQMSFIYEFPSQQKPAKRRGPPPLKRKKTEQEPSEPSWCAACGFYPSPTDWRRKLEKHNKTGGHRKRTGQDLTETDKYPCLHCPSEYNRKDNMRQHTRVVHGIQQSPGRARGRRKHARREIDR